MKINSELFKIKPHRKVSLKKTKTHIKPFYKSTSDATEYLNEGQHDIADHQEHLYAQQTWSVLLILQGMDTAGKDGLIKHVLKDVDPQGCSVTSFKKPSGSELKHDFLWRSHVPMAQRGEIKVFNRSYYEDIVVPQVVPEILQESGLPKEILKSKDLIKNRCEDIVNFEKYLSNQGVLVVKIFLHLSKDEQKNRLLARFDDPDKNWKVEESDVVARSSWAQFQKAYEYCLSHTSHKAAPWYIIPADDKVTARIIASKILSDEMKKLRLDYPHTSKKQKSILSKLKKRL